jgi:uncharacterized iron-regulated membrane protein
MKDKNFGEKTVGANYDIHVGSILGLPTKIIAFIVSLICASLPVTGFMIWWGRRKRKRRKQHNIFLNKSLVNRLIIRSFL